MHFLDFITKSPNPHAWICLLLQLRHQHGDEAAVWGESKKVQQASFLLNMHFVSLTLMLLAEKQIIHGLKYIYVNFAVNVIINV